MLKLPCMLKAQFKHRNRRLWINFFWSIIRRWPFSPTHALAANKMTVGVDRILWKQFDRETTLLLVSNDMLKKVLNWHKIRLIVLKKNHTSYTSVNGAHIYLCHSCNHFLKISAAEKASLNSKVSWNVRLLLLLLPSTTVWTNLFPPLYKSVLCIPWCTHTLLCHSAVRAQWVRLLAFAGSGHLWAIPPVPVASRHGQKNLSDTWRVPTLIKPFWEKIGGVQKLSSVKGCIS